jgi:hypothetical protein
MGRCLLPQAPLFNVGDDSDDRQDIVPAISQVDLLADGVLILPGS